MTTIINTPQSPVEDSSSGIVLGIIFGALIVILFLVFGVRYYWHSSPTATPAQSPTQSTVVVPGGGTTINVSAPAVPTNTTGSTSGNSY